MSQLDPCGKVSNCSKKVRLHLYLINTVFEYKCFSGLLEGLQPRGRGDVKIEEIKLFRLKTSSAIGAAFLAAKKAGILLPVDFGANAEVFFQSTI